MISTDSRDTALPVSGNGQATVRDAPVVPLRVGGLIIGLLGVFPLAALIKYAQVVEWLPAALVEWAVCTALLILVCVLIARTLGDRTDQLIARATSALLAPAPREFAAWAALIVLAVSMWLSWYCFNLVPIGLDALTQRFQARLLLHGRLWIPQEQHVEFFSSIQSVMRDGRWFGQFPIGGPLLLVPGAAINVPWLVNPALSAWTAVSFYRFASRTTDELTARGATLLFVLSPFVLLMSAMQMNHVGALALIMFALAGLAQWATSDDAHAVRRGAMQLGFGMAAAATVRPYDAALVALVIGVFQLTVLARSRTRVRSLAWQIGAGLVPLTILLYANWRTTGAPLLFGYDAVNGTSHRPGFHVDPSGVDFTPMIGLHHISSYLLRLNASLFMGPIPGVVMVVMAMLLVKRPNRWDYLLLGIILALSAGYAVYWAESFVLGTPRFLYCAIPALVIFVAKLPGTLRARARGATTRRVIVLILPLAMMVTWVTPPHVAAYVGAWATALAVRGQDPERQIDLRKEIARSGLTDVLVFVHEPWHGRLAARLRALGAPDLTAESMASELDACALQRALDEEDNAAPPPKKSRLNRVALKALLAGTPQPIPGLVSSSAIKLVNGLVPPDCLPQLLADRDGTMALDKFLPFLSLDADGRLGGNIVFARDLGRRNALLLDRFGDRAWYRYRPHTDPADTTPRFLPYRGRGPTIER